MASAVILVILSPAVWVAVLGHADLGLTAIFGSPDDLKFRSSMTLFGRAAAPAAAPYAEALATFRAGEDPATLRLLGLS